MSVAQLTSLQSARAAPLVTGDASFAVSKPGTVLARLACLAIVTLLLLAFGGIDAMPLNVAGAGLFALAAWVLLVAPVEPSMRWVVVAAIVLPIILGAWVLMRSAPSISAGWDDSLAAIVPIALPFAVFLIAAGLWPTESDALKLLRIIGFVVAGFAVYGLVQLTLSPAKVLFVRPSLHPDSLTATFLSRDAAATLFGAIAVPFLVRSIDLARRLARRQDRARDLIRFLLVCVGTMVAIGALVLTHSKTGITSSAIALALSAGLAAALPNAKRTRRFDWRQVLRRIGLGAAVAVATGLAVGLLAGRTLSRGTVPTEDGSMGACQADGLVRMLLHNWLLGTGAGTFTTEFPAYGSIECGISQAGVTTHSGGLEGWITLGLPFIAVTITAAIVLAILLIRGLVNRRRLRWVPIVGFGLLILMAASAASDNSIELPALSALLAALFAPICVICASDPQRS